MTSTGMPRFRASFTVSLRVGHGETPLPGDSNRSSLGFLVSHARRRSSGPSRSQEYNFKRELRFPRASPKFLARDLGSLDIYTCRGAIRILVSFRVAL